MRQQIFEQISKLEAIAVKADAERERLKLNNEALNVYIDSLQKQIHELRKQIHRGAKP